MVAPRDRNEPSRTALKSGYCETPRLTWHYVNWQPHRDRLIADADFEGIKLLDELLPELKEDVRGVRVLTSVYLLDLLRDRGQARQFRRPLTPILEMPEANALEVCAKWQALAKHAEMVSRWNEGRRIWDFRQARRYWGGLPSPDWEWAEAFRESTERLVPHAIKQRLDDRPLHILLQRLDQLLEKEQVDLTEPIRDADVVSRGLCAREQARKARNKSGDGETGRRDAVEERIRGRQAWIISVVKRFRTKPRSIAAVYEKLVQDGTEPVNRRTLTRDLIAIRDQGGLRENQLPPLPSKCE